MNAEELLSELCQRGYSPAAVGDRLKLRGPGRPPADIESEIIASRDALLEVLRSEQDLPDHYPDLLPAIRAMLSQYPNMAEFPADYIAINLTIFGEYRDEPPVAEVEAALEALDIEREAA